MSDYLSYLQKLAKSATPGPWGIYDNGFDAGVVSGLRPTTPAEDSAFNCNLYYEGWICGGEPHEDRMGPQDPNTQIIAEFDPKLVKVLLKIAAAAQSIEEFPVSKLYEALEELDAIGKEGGH